MKRTAVTGMVGLRMNLVGGDQPSPTEFVTFRERYPANPCLGSVNEPAV